MVEKSASRDCRQLVAFWCSAIRDEDDLECDDETNHEEFSFEETIVETEAVDPETIPSPGDEIIGSTEVEE